MSKSIVGLVALLGLLMIPAVQDPDLEGIKCVVMAKAPAKAEKVVEYKDGKVYLCCDRCVGNFTANTEKFATKANHQLALTGQFEQTGCPISGGAIDPDTAVDVGGVKVAFCCGNCKSSVEAAADLEAKAELVFTDDAFGKAFAAKAAKPDLTNVKCMLMPAKNVKEEKFVEYAGAKVYFCCDNCVRKFDADKNATKANQQLVTTKQFKQTKCPISGSDVTAGVEFEVNGVNVGFCCDNCKSKVESAKEDDRAELVFGKDAFGKAFEKK